VQAIGRQPRQAPGGAPIHCERRRPEQTTLYCLLQQHAATFFAGVDSGPVRLIQRFGSAANLNIHVPGSSHSPQRERTLDFGQPNQGIGLSLSSSVVALTKPNWPYAACASGVARNARKRAAFACRGPVLSAQTA